MSALEKHKRGKRMQQIDQGIPLAIQKKRYPFARMVVGDSFFFEELTEVESAQNAGYSYAKRHNPAFKMTRRKVEGGYRLWRIA